VPGEFEQFKEFNVRDPTELQPEIYLLPNKRFHDTNSALTYPAENSFILTESSAVDIAKPWVGRISLSSVIGKSRTHLATPVKWQIESAAMEAAASADSLECVVMKS
jgi:hypothetical protein